MIWIRTKRGARKLSDFDPTKIRPSWWRDNRELHRLLAVFFLLGAVGAFIVMVLSISPRVY